MTRLRLALALAATFAAMAVLGEVGPGAHGAAPVASMSTMYLLMAMFHAGPWLGVREWRIVR